MKRYRIILFILITLLLAGIPKINFSQQPVRPVHVDSTRNDSVIIAWVENLYKEGVMVTNDSVVISEETIRLMAEETYRNLIYPKTYTWDMVKYFIQNQDLRKAYWYMINLFMADEKSREMTVQYLLMYDRLFKMDKILVNTFYTYVLTDPEIGRVTEGRFEVTAPHVMEKKLNALREILFYIDKYKPANRKEDPATPGGN